MRVWIIAFALVAACKGKDKDKAVDPPAPPPQAAGPAVPAVKVATAVARDDGKPPFLLLVDDAGTVRLAAAKTWADLDANKLTVAKKPAPVKAVDRFVHEMTALGRDPTETIATWDEGSEIDLAALDDDKDDPPPPPPEDDESGGTGTAMALEEGVMGKTDSDRAEGQYKMKKTDVDPQLARQQAIEQARNAGILGAPAVGGVSGGVVGHGIPNEDGTPSRLADVAGVVAKDGKLQRLRAMIVIAPTAKAGTLIETIRATDGAIAVVRDGKVRPLALDFGQRPGEGQAWIEARISAKGVTVEAVPDVPIEVAALDQLGAAVDKARTARGRAADAPVDILVAPDVDVQRLVDVAVALATANVKVIGMGRAPSADELARRGHRTPATAIGQPNSVGDLDKAEIRKVVKAARQKITYCYERALLAAPTLAGTVQAQFFIKPDGTVGAATASGVSPEVADCVGKTIKALTFPKPKGGGGVQVNYPFTMHQ